MNFYRFDIGKFSSNSVNLNDHFSHQDPSGRSWAQFCTDKGWTAEDIQRDIQTAEWHAKLLERRATERQLCPV